MTESLVPHSTARKTGAPTIHVWNRPHLTHVQLAARTTRTRPSSQKMSGTAALGSLCIASEAGLTVAGTPGGTGWAFPESRASTYTVWVGAHPLLHPPLAEVTSVRRELPTWRVGGSGLPGRRTS